MRAVRHHLGSRQAEVIGAAHSTDTGMRAESRSGNRRTPGRTGRQSERWGDQCHPRTRLTAVQQAQARLARYIEPGERHFEQTINELLDVLDRDTVVAAVEEMQSRRQARRAARRARSRRARPKNTADPDLPPMCMISRGSKAPIAAEVVKCVDALFAIEREINGLTAQGAFTCAPRA